MEKLTTWLFVGLMAYICFLLTSINHKLETYNISETEVAVLNEVRNQSFTTRNRQDVSHGKDSTVNQSSMHVWLIILVMIASFLSWNFSRIYHSKIWAKRNMRKRNVPFSEPMISEFRPTPLHPDQECIGDPPPVDGGIRDSWLPVKARAMRKPGSSTAYR